MSTPRLVEFFKGKEGAAITATVGVVEKLVKENKIDISKASLRDIAWATLGAKGMQILQEATSDGAGMQRLKEEVDPVNSQAFMSITGLLVTQGVVTAYQSPTFIGNQLVTEETSTEDNTRETGLAPIGDEALVVPEGEEYPDTKFGQDYIDVPGSVKRGLKIGLTREMIFFDRTGKVLEAARGIGERLGVSKEVRILRVFLGIDNTFKRNGVTRNTYVATGTGDPRINKLAGNPLTDWHDIDDANALFLGMLDDRQPNPEPIQVTPNTIVVSPYKLWNAQQILTASELRRTTNTAVDTTISGNVVAGKYNLLSSVWLDRLLVSAGGISASNARDFWHIGDPKRAFAYRTLFPLEVRSAPSNNEAEFNRDVLAQFRASERGVAYVRAPWLNVQNYNA